jgi:hypothetical protein
MRVTVSKKSMVQSTPTLSDRWNRQLDGFFQIILGDRPKLPGRQKPITGSELLPKLPEKASSVFTWAIHQTTGVKVVSVTCDREIHTGLSSKVVADD